MFTVPLVNVYAIEGIVTMDDDPGGQSWWNVAQLKIWQRVYRKRVEKTLFEMACTLQRFRNKEQYYAVITCEDFTQKVVQFNKDITELCRYIDKVSGSQSLGRLFPEIVTMAQEVLSEPRTYDRINSPFSYASHVYGKLHAIEQLHLAIIAALHLHPVQVQRAAKVPATIV